MKNLLFAFIFCLFSGSIVFAQTTELNLIPQPKSVTRTKGEFKLNYKTKIVATDEIGRKSAGILNDLLLKNYGFKLEYTDKAQRKMRSFFCRKTHRTESLPMKLTVCISSRTQCRSSAVKRDNFMLCKRWCSCCLLNSKAKRNFPPSIFPTNRALNIAECTSTFRVILCPFRSSKIHRSDVAV